MSSNLNAEFQERLAEVEAYLAFLTTMEVRAKEGPPRIEGSEQPITVQQQRILYSSVYLQLYNLVEATVTGCINAVENATKYNARWRPDDLSNELKREWVRMTARTHVELTPDHRLESAMSVCNHLVASSPIYGFSIDGGGGGNWDDSKIEALGKRLGCQLVVSPAVYSAVKQPFRDELGPLALVKDLRNRLAHGSISFAQCAEDVSVGRLVDLKEKTVNYLKEVLDCFTVYVEGFEFLLPEKRPA